MELPNNPDNKRYQIIEKIGQGGFSIVYRVKDIKTNEYYAAKISKFMISEDTKDSPVTLSLFREVKVLINQKRFFVRVFKN